MIANFGTTTPSLEIRCFRCTQRYKHQALEDNMTCSIVIMFCSICLNILMRRVLFEFRQLYGPTCTSMLLHQLAGYSADSASKVEFAE